MSERLAYTKYDLGYPPWALDFDPYNRGYILIGGGGGEGQKEVPNRLTLLDVSSRSKLEKAAELSIANSEDCPVSLGVLGTKEGLIAYAGINSGAEERGKGLNKHFRSFKIDYPERIKEQGKQSQGSITALGQTPLFTGPANSGDVFQRLLRLSPASKRVTGSKRIGAIANSLAKESQIVLFNATAASPSPADVIERIKPLQNAEANDIDIFETKEGNFLVAYCTNTEVYLQSITYDFTAKNATKLFPQEPAAVHSIPYPDAFQKPARPKVRSIRFLTPNHVLLLQNHGGQSQMVILRVFQDGGDGSVILRKQLPKRVGAAVSLDVAALDADPDTGAQQIVVAVAAQSEDISIYTLDYLGPSKDTISTFTLYSDLRGAHTMAMKKVALSPFHTPGASSEGVSNQKPKTPVPQFLRLASISLSNTVVVDHLPLHLLSTGKRSSRYVLSKGRKSSALSTGSSVLVISFVLLVSLLLLQSFLSAGDSTGSASTQLLPQALVQRFSPYADRINDFISPYVRKAEENAAPIAHSKSAERLKSLLHLHHKSRDAPSEQQKSLVIRAPEAGEAELSTEVHHDTAELLRKDADARRWEELSHEQQALWKKRLVRAGVWSAEYGETILKGIFFSEYAGAVGRAAAQALAGGG